jgi:hypothetical protein
MKKFLLVPIIALSLMTACDLNQPPKITLDMWLENCENIEEKDYGFYDLYTIDFKSINRDYDTIDYENYVIKAIKEGAASATPKKKRPEKTGDNLVCYILTNGQECGAEGCLLYVYENYIMTFTDFHYKGKYVSQRYYYEYDTEVGKKIINTSIARADEILNTTKEETMVAKEEATIENFLAKAEETTTFTMTYNNSNITDENRSFLNALKDKELIKVNSEERVYLLDENKLAVYQLNENLSLWLAKDSFITKFNNNNDYNIIQVCYHYRPKFIKDSYYQEGAYGHRTTYLISKETHNELTQVLDSLVAE